MIARQVGLRDERGEGLRHGLVTEADQRHVRGGQGKHPRLSEVGHRGQHPHRQASRCQSDQVGEQDRGTVPGHAQGVFP